MKLEQQQEIAYQSDDTVASDVGVLHDGKSPFPGGAAAKAVKEVRQPVFVQATGDKQACDEARIHANDTGIICPASHSTAAITPPVSQPTSGQ